MRFLLFATLVLCAPTLSRAQQAPPDPDTPARASQEDRPTGLPAAVTWTFNMDAGWGTFGFANSLFVNPKDPGTNENLSDQWFEGYMKPALSGTYTLGSGSVVYGKVSAVGERTYGSVPSSFGDDVSSFGPEDLSIGWRSGDALSLGDNAVDLVVGRAPYHLGHGMLLWDGASEGGSRGGYWTNARGAFEFAAVGRFKPGPHAVEAFYLDRDELPENDSHSRVAGLNYEYTFGKDGVSTIGITYMKFAADAELRPGRDALNVFNTRAYVSPLASTPDLSIEFEYATERNGDVLVSDAWTIQGAYKFSEYVWEPRISYRYAFFEGDDPATPVNESFDPLFPGFSDWGTWWQGEIAGEYFLANSNLKSHQIRVHVAPSESLSGGLMFFGFRLDHPQALGPQVTDTDVALEIDAYADWKFTRNFTLSLVGAYGDPGKAVQQYSGRTKNFAYGMAYLGYHF